MRHVAAALAVIALLGAPGFASAAPQSAPPSFNPPDAEACFRSEQVVRYQGETARSLIVRTSTGRYYRIGFAAVCPNVMRKDVAITVIATGGSSLVCRPIDLKIIANASEFPMNCAVDSIQPLSAVDVRALPAKARP